jgi:hypothetical protein
MAAPIEPSSPSTAELERIAGVTLLAAMAVLAFAVLLYLSDSPWKPAVLGVGLLVTLFGLIAFEEALRDRGERLLPRFGTIAFAIGSTAFVFHDVLGADSGHYVTDLERVYTVLACTAVALFGWSILRSRALPAGVGWFAVAWGIAFGVLYLARISTPPLGPNVAAFVFGVALVRRVR